MAVATRPTLSPTEALQATSPKLSTAELRAAQHETVHAAASATTSCRVCCSPSSTSAMGAPAISASSGWLSTSTARPATARYSQRSTSRSRPGDDDSAPALVQGEDMITIASLAATHWHDGRGWDGPPWPAFFLVPLLLAAMFIVGVWYQRGRRPTGAVDIVAERYASGEIDETEYRRRVSELRGKGSPPAGGSQ